jgi:hypothetical protein
MAQRATSDIVSVSASHLSMISHPDAVTELILEAAGANDQPPDRQRGETLVKPSSS